MLSYKITARRFMQLTAALMALAATIGFFAAPAMAADQTIAFVNSQDILNKCAAANGLKEAANNKVKEFQAELKSKSAALNKEEEELGKQRSVLSQDAFDAKVKAFRQKATDAQRDAQEKKGKIDKALGTGFNEIQKTFVDIVTKIAKDKGYKSVVTTSATVYYDPSLDISSEVMEKLNKQLPKVALKFE